MRKSLFAFTATLNGEVGGVWFATTSGDVVGACRGVPFAFLVEGEFLGARAGTAVECQKADMWVLVGEEGSLPDVKRAVSLVKSKTGLGG